MRKSDFNPAFDHAYSTNSQNEFEDWFRAMAECVYENDFETIKAGGIHGDKKSDGRIISEETVFQCYAPESSEKFAKHAPKKIIDSFPEVTTYWPDLKKWVLVHNNAGGISTSTSDTLEELRKTYSTLKIEEGSRRLLKDLHDQLSLQHMLDIYPSAHLDFGEVQMGSIRPLLKKIEAEHVAPINPLDFGEEPDPEKLAFNELSTEARFNIQRARKGVGIIDRYMNSLSRPNTASIIQSAISEKYETLRDLGHTPDEILAELLKFVGNDGTASITASTYVIVTYYFEACDIFENVPAVAPC